MSCQHFSSRILDSRKQGLITYRRKLCLNCGERFSTYEMPISRAQADWNVEMWREGNALANT